MEKNKLRAPYHSEEVENKWEISYGDMITLLLGFFVLFFNIKSETMNIQLIQKDISQHFDFDKRSRAGRVVASVPDSGQESQIDGVSESLAKMLKVKTNMDGEKLVIEFPGISFYNSSSYELTDDGKLALQEFAKSIQKHVGIFKLIVRGYTDITPVRSGFRYKDNLELSAFRSISAIRYLASKGLDLNHMRIAGFGESADMVDETEKLDLSQQRKVVIVIEPLDHTERQPAKIKSPANNGEKQ
jgi:chemotaxis protein MotB